MTPEVAWRILNPPKVDPEMTQLKEEIKTARRVEAIEKKKQEMADKLASESVSDVVIASGGEADDLTSASSTTEGKKIQGDALVYDHLCSKMNSISDVKLKLRKATQDAMGGKAGMLSAPD